MHLNSIQDENIQLFIVSPNLVLIPTHNQELFTFSLLFLWSTAHMAAKDGPF